MKFVTARSRNQCGRLLNGETRRAESRRPTGHYPAASEHGPGAGIVRAAACGAWLMILASAVPTMADDEPAAFFAAQVQPILVSRCLPCHASDRKGGLDLRSGASLLEGGESGAVVTSGEPDESLLIDYVVSETMPPNKPLSSDEVESLRRWVADGAYFPETPLDLFAETSDVRAGYDWWSLRPLADVPPPEPEGIPDIWFEHAVDRFVFEQLRRRGLRPSARADKRTLIRRATYDLTGLPPTPDEIRAFEADPAPDAYARLLDRLLASPHYGEQWGRHWLDVVRFGESIGFERNQIINNAWPFRDYVIRSFNDNKPFDQLVREHLAGDVIGVGQNGVEVGTTFLVCGPYDDVGNQDPVQAAQIRANTVDDMIRATSEAFLGLTVGCGRCHDHKFDPIRQTDYYSMYAALAGVHHGSREMGSDLQKQQRAEQLAPLQQRKDLLEQQRAELDADLAKTAKLRADEFAARWIRPPVSRQGTEETLEPVLARYVRLTVQGTDTDPRASGGHRIDEFEVWTHEPTPRNVALADAGALAEGKSPVAEDFADAYSAELAIDGRFGAPWIASGPELRITLAQPETIDRVYFSSDRTGAGGDQPVATFVGEYQISISLDGQQWQEVASSATRQPASEAHRLKRLVDQVITTFIREHQAELARQLAEVNAQIAAIPPLPSWWVGTFQVVSGPQRVFLGGSPQQPGEEVVAASLSTLDRVTQGYQLTADAPESARRLRLAEWIVARDNPLTPRVLANRLWHYHFGIGIVDTPSDFGFMGGRPTHPELLDWLARQIQAADWRLKELHKMIMMSQTYQQASTFDEGATRVDADSRYLWRFPPRRLSAEEIRDTLLVLAGKMDFTAGGPGYRLYHYMQDNVATYVPLDTFGPATYRRSVYHQNARAMLVDMMTEFDAPDCAFAAPRRATTTTPLQALSMMNHSFSLDVATFMADRVRQDVARDGDPVSHGAETSEMLVRRAFELAFARSPGEQELHRAVELVDQYGLPALCRAILNTNELIYLD